ncbi:hydrogenase subunit MbhD domain-containing protein [Nitrincola alkalilacustris]|uniref:hydrogenase subunit MbhD domain-containing protein n=1 Tax=Nitrincola alkalilacustris TaxID=1571224 RepID=UPI001456700F|nr:hydrogenase subunit MbhD domain-containing protein [Nitrincola alkalilacustris]
MSVLLDLLLLSSLWVFALLTLTALPLFRGVVFFILLGLMLALVWIRLDAPDIALAEAAIGAGITGVLLLDTLGHLHHRADQESSPIRLKSSRFWVALISSLSLAGLLLWALLDTPATPTMLAEQVARALPNSGVDHPITAVLLNFRSYDTLLEIGVLVVAILVGLTLADKDSAQLSLPKLPNPLLQACLALLVPLMLMVSSYLLWAGSKQPGGAFQAGAVLAATGILLHLSGFRLTLRTSERLMRAGLLLGFSVFLLVAASALIDGQPLLTYPDHLAGILILIIELALTLSIGLILLSLFTLPHFALPEQERPK